MATESCSMFDDTVLGLMNGIRVIGYKYDDDKDVDQVKEKAVDCQDKSGVSCQVCKVVAFDSVKSQRDHFKLDWHRFNIKQRLMGKPTVSEEDFEETISGELSSISGSDSSETDSSDDDDDFTLEGTAQTLPENPLDSEEYKERRVKHDRSHPKIFLSNSEKCVFSLYRAVVYSSKNIPEEQATLMNKLSNLTKESSWVILMTAGGHFAAAYFEGDSVVAHKTFHRYTVRAKRGTAQGMRDSQQGRQPKSAGASLRRYNEAALIQEVHDLLEAWSEYLEKCHKIFIRVQTYNKPMFFGGKKPPLDKNDSRIRTIPFATRRPTFKEVQRVQQELAKLEILGHENDVLSVVLSQLSPSPKKNQTKTPVTDPQTDDNTTHKITDQNELDESNDSIVGSGLCEPVEDTIRNTSVSNKKNKKKKSNSRIADGNGKEKMSRITGGPDRDVVLPGHHVWNRLYCAIVSGNMKVIIELLPSNETEKDNTRTLEQSGEDTQTNEFWQQEDEEVDEIEKVTETIQDVKLIDGSENSEGQNVDAREVVNEQWGEEGSTLLHVAAKTTQTQIIDILMRNGADPSIKDDRGRTPYNRAKSKEARDEFRRFMADFPDAFDYTKSHIPSPLTQEMKEEKERKEAEKKKAQKKAKKQRIKEQKAAEQKKQEEEDEKKKNKTMSEREKRALAAEGRFAKQQLKKSGGSSGSCAMCSQDLTGRVPFERLDFKYCSTECVRKHRLILENKDR